MTPIPLLLVGDGAVARALAAGFSTAGQPVTRWWRGQGGEPPEADVAILAVSDGAVSEVARRVRADVLLSCAGGLPIDAVFAGMNGGKGLLHPLRALAGGPSDGNLAETVFGIAGDAAGLSAARRLVDVLGGVPLVLTAESQPRYHAAAVLVSNHTLALVATATALLSDLDPRVAESALADLLGSAVANIRALHLPAALTGPMARGDVATIQTHLAALPPEAAALYRATGRALLTVAEAKGQADPATLVAIGRLLDKP